MESPFDGMIDFEMGKVYLGRDHDAFLKRFIEIDLQVYINKLQNTYERLDFEELMRCCDSLFSTSAYVGAKTCQEISKKILEHAKKNEISGISCEISNLIEHSERLEEVLKEYFNSLSVVSGGSGNDKINNMSVEENLSDPVSFRLKPPLKRINEMQGTDREEEFDPYLEINKEWKCFIS